MGSGNLLCMIGAVTLFGRTFMVVRVVRPRMYFGRNATVTLLGIYPVIRSFFQNMNMENIGHDMRLGINSFYCLCEVLDSLKHAATGSIAVAAFQSKIEAHLIAFKVP